MSDVPMKKFDWEIRRELGVGYYRTYAHGYWRPFVVCVLGRTLIGKRALRKSWERYHEQASADRRSREAAPTRKGTVI